MTETVSPELNRKAFLRSLHISRRFNLAYVNNAKVACSTIKLSLQRAEVNDLAFSPEGSVHNFASSPLLTWPEVAMDGGPLSDRYVFSFVRNPYDRLRSAYLNKIVTGQKNGKPRVDAGFGSDECPDFGSFVESISKIPPRLHNPHWRPQVINLSLGKITYDFIGRLEHFDTDWARLCAQTGLPRMIHVAGRRTRSAATESVRFTPSICALIEHAYTSDFAVFGYIFDRPLG